jgi:hypothetical protein
MTEGPSAGLTEDPSDYLYNFDRCILTGDRSQLHAASHGAENHILGGHKLLFE